MLRGIEWVIAFFFIVFRYRVVFFSSFFLSILAFIIYALGFFWVSLNINITILGLFVAIIYLRGIIVLFSYSFMLKDIKVSFIVSTLNVFFVLFFLLSLGQDGFSILSGMDLTEVYSSRASILVYRRVLLYCVLRVSLSLCLRAKVI